jgi:hypothetical protein
MGSHGHENPLKLAKKSFQKKIDFQFKKIVHLGSLSNSSSQTLQRPRLVL